MKKDIGIAVRYAKKKLSSSRIEKEKSFVLTNAERAGGTTIRRFLSVKHTITLFARIAGRSLSLTETRIVNTVRGDVMPMSEEKKLTEEECVNLTGYQLAMSLADEILRKGLITEDEHAKIEAQMCDKYCIKITSIFRDFRRK